MSSPAVRSGGIADSGTVQVLGLDPKRARVELACRLGVQVQEFNLQATVQVRESLSFFASLHADPEDVDELLGRFGLADKAKARFPTLSGGQKRRLAIAKALVGRPEVVVLDEPTSGLDPQGQQFLRLETRRLRDEGRAVVLSTHDVEDAARLADHVIIVDHGRVIAAGTPGRVVTDHCRNWRLVIEGGPRTEWSTPADALVIDDGNQTILYGEDRDALRASVPRAVVLEDRAPTLHDAYFLLTGTALRS